VAATIRNEQYFYKNLLDTGPDHYAKGHGGWPYAAEQSIGPAQIQVGTIRQLVKEFPTVLGPAETAVTSAEDIHRAHYFVAAYFADVIHGIERKKKPEFISNDNWKQINEKWQRGKLTEALIISYNPDHHQIEQVGTQLKRVKEKDLH
jgi:hypothetical protein